MGQEIVYCVRCQSQLRGTDFDKGRAVRSGPLSYCRSCAPEEALAGADTAHDPEPPPSTNTPKPRPALKETTPKSGTHARVPRGAEAAPPPKAAGATAKLAIGGGAAAAILVVLVALAASTRGAPRPKPAPAPPPEPAATTLPPAPAPPPEVRPPPRETARKPAEHFQADLARLDSEVQAALRKESLQEAMGLLEEARKRFADPEWGMGIDKRARDLGLEIEKLFAAAKAEAVEAKRQGDKERVTKAGQRVASWGIEARKNELAAALAVVERPAPAPPPKPPDPPPPPPEAEAFRKRWEAAAAMAAARDYAGGLRDLEQAAAALRDEKLRAEAAADVEVFSQAGAFLADALKAFAAWPKGERLVVSILDDTGTLQRVEANSLPVVPWGEVLAGSMVEALSAREPRRPSLAGPGPAAFCLLDGDPEGAAKAQRPGAPPVPDKYWAHARNPGSPDAEEQKARTLFAAAEREHAELPTAAEAVLKFRSLLTEFAGTRVVRRNREYVASRAQGAREFLFLASDWNPAGSFRMGRHNKMESCWISDRDDAPARLKENFVEIVFSALPEAEYRCWAYVGGCCLEVFGFSVTGTEFPGGDAPVPAKMPSFFGAPKNHAAHTGPKEPDRWTWVPIPLPRYATAGTKHVRLHTTQKGFSAAYAFVSAIKTAPPRESDIKDAEKARGEAAGESGLIGLWKFDEGKGTSALDASRNRNHAMLRNGPAWAAGKAGGALTFDGVDDQLVAPDARFRAVVDTFTMAFWASPAATRQSTPEAATGATGTLKQRYVIVPTHGTDSGAAGAGVSVGTNGISVFEHASSHLPSLLVHDAPIAGWVHVAVVFERRQPKLYVNGALVKTGVASTKAVFPSPANVGSEYGYYKGAVDDVRVYDRALTPAEVAALAGAAVPAAEAGTKARSPKEGLQVLYRFEEGKGTTVRDVSGVGTALDLQIADEGAVRWSKKRGLLVAQSTYVASAGPATKVIEACKASHELAIEAWVRPANAAQTGPARIVSVSPDINNRNFTLGQAAGAYEVRLRTSSTGANGIPPSTTAAGAEPRLTHVLYSRAASGATRLYVNGVEAGAGSVGGDFTSWNAGYRLILANELTRERTWLGEYHQVAVYSRVFTAAEAVQKFKAGLDEK